MNGISVLLIERSFGGVSTRRMDCQGVWSSGTTYITFEDVKVPVENLIGKENQGFKVIMTNFNHERIGIIIQAVRFSRVCYEESVKYANKRRTFGQKLINHAVIRMKLAQMARQIEATYSWLESLIYQCQMMSDTEAMLKLGGAIAGCKAQATLTFEFCAREASQIFGGLSYSRGGQGAKVERLYRDVRAYAIPGGSEVSTQFSQQSLLECNKANKVAGNYARSQHETVASCAQGTGNEAIGYPSYSLTRKQERHSRAFRHSGLQCDNSTKLHPLRTSILEKLVIPITFKEALT